jgi:hypothetical protein
VSGASRQDQLLLLARNLKAWNNAPYDGVLGQLPKWMPKNFHRQFRRLRGILLHTYSHDDLLGFIAEAAEVFYKDEKNPTVSRSLMPDGICFDILDLAKFQEAVRLGKEAGLSLLTDPDHAKHVTMGEGYSRQQSDKASKPRGKVSDDGETIGDIIGKIAVNAPKESAKELWTRFYGELDRLNLDPREVNHPTDLKKSVIEYNDAKSKRRKITFGQFAKVVSTFRTRKKLP